MKRFIGSLILTNALLSLPAFAVLPEGHDFKTRAESTWKDVKTMTKEVQTKVLKWWDEFNAPSPQEVAKQKAEEKKTYQAPVVEQQASDSKIEDVQKVKQAAQKAKAFDVVEKGRPADPSLKKTTVGVPYISQAEIDAIKAVPHLNVGLEDRVSKADFTLPKLGWSAQSPKDLQPLKSASILDQEDLKKALGGKLRVVGQVRTLTPNFKPVENTMTLAKAKDFAWPETTVAEVVEKPYNPLSAEELKMVAALILFAKGTHCHMVMGLMSELSEVKSTQYEALYHLGACADQLKMNEASFKAFTRILKSPKVEEYASEALEILARGLHKDAEKEFYMVVKQIKDLDKILTDKSKGPVYYRLAKGAFKSQHFNRTWQHASNVPESSDYWADAQVLASMGYFNANKKKLAIEKLASLDAELSRKGFPNNNIKALIKTNLARMRFLHGNIEESLPLYVSVPKDHGLWVQALIEQGWAQLYMDDYAGAIGNMYSLHSPYFKIVYQPESFVVRTIGYLNICQYGDAYKTLSKLEEDYRAWHGNLNNYLTSTRKPAQVYETVKTYLNGKSTDDVENLPHQILREAARGRDFLNSQSALNEKADELVRYEGVNSKIKEEKASIRNRERQAKARFDEQRLKLKAALADKKLAKNVDEAKKRMKFEKELVVGYRFQLAILEQSRQGYIKFQTTSQKEVEQTKMALRTEASETLKSRLSEMKTQIARVLDNNEMLRYEVFAGSGENIRYQVAGGSTEENTRVPASIKPQKSLNWSFDGEFWEDEIGNYRSSLRNNCPREQAMLNKGEN